MRRFGNEPAFIHDNRRLAKRGFYCYAQGRTGKFAAYAACAPHASSGEVHSPTRLRRGAQEDLLLT